jgi:signal transduction histidine kinase
MGNHAVARATGDSSQYTTEATASHSTSPRRLALQNWPVSTRLIAVIILALLMGLVFGGLQVASATSSANEFGRVSQLAGLGQQVADLVQALEDERDETAGIAPLTQASGLSRWYSATNAAAARVQSLAAGIGGSFPANIQTRVATVVSDIKDLPGLRTEAQASQSAVVVIGAYAHPITDMIALDDQIGQGTSDASLTSDVQTLNAMALAKDQAAQQRALLYNAFLQKGFADQEQQALGTAASGQLIDLTAFFTTATPAEQSIYHSAVAGTSANDLSQNIVNYVQDSGSLAGGAAAAGINPKQAAGAWYAAQSGTVDGMQQVELDVARNIVARAQSLQTSAERTALFTAILVTVILLVVLMATIAVARSLVGPLRRLREGALTIATVELPERVRLLGEGQDPSTSAEVAPIDVLSADEIGQVARAFDQVHSEAVRLASNEAMLRNSFNAMFVSLSRRSQSLIERLVRMIDALEQNEGDPDRLSNLFAMDHLVTRMRRNSENLLLLAGHESARKWSQPVALADVARAAVSEIEQYSRVSLRIQPGVAVSGQAVSDVVHLLAEVIENATIFSSKDTPVHVSAQEVISGGVLIEVADSGVGIPDSRLAEINWRLDNPPIIDVAVSRHMGLFAVARLAERHGVRVRLRAKSPQGLTALVWLPDNVTERTAQPYGGRSQPFAAYVGHQGVGATGRHGAAVRTALDDPAGTAPRQTVPVPVTGPVPVTASAASDWFADRRSAAVRTAGNGGQPGAKPSRGGLAGIDEWAESRQAAQIIANPVRGDTTTSAGLPVRIPQANLLPGSVGGGRHRPDRPEAPKPAFSRPPHSPDVARSRLSGFQRGTRRAKGQTPTAAQGQTPSAVEGAER